ncbi:MAG: DUF6340 family protein [Phocaeicola sp.]|uniref:DUF6340 family protein n=1 Tax=Phocaeicola sp. TaxID=2773926 RepID=UPI003FA0B8CC
MRRLQFLIAAVVAIMLTSCGSIGLIQIDQLQPAKIAFPEQVRNVAVVNNVPPAEYDSAYYIRSGKREYEGNGSVLTQDLATALAEGKYFDKVVICDSLLYQNSLEDSQTYHPLHQEQVEQLANDLDADMIISADRLYIKNKDVQVYDDLFDSIESAAEAKYVSLVHLYIPGREKPFMTLTEKDSLTFVLYGSLKDREIADEVAKHAGYKLSDALIPYWLNIQRTYYDGGISDMRDAGVAFRENNLDEAYRLWNKVYTSKKGKTKARAAFNIALYYEMKDDLEKAVEFIGKAESLVKELNDNDRNMIHYYKVALLSRQKDIVQLNIQMRRFNKQNDTSN